MRITELRLAGYRNIGFAQLGFSGNRTFLLGRNGQGKSNILEGLHLITHLRSFRGAEQRALIGWEAQGQQARLLMRIAHPQMGETEVEIELRAAGKTVRVGGEPIKRLEQFIGAFPTVCFHSQDLQLLRGGPSLRRRFLDLLLSGSEPGYFAALTGYYKAMRERNAALKQGHAATVVAAFEPQMIENGSRILAWRRAFVQRFSEPFAQAYAGISAVEEQPMLGYESSIEATTVDGYAARLGQRREADRRQGTTSVGPHRDDLRLALFGRDARAIASEGQQRGLVLALRLAEVAWIRGRRNLQPVILADDILGELDPLRREGFWNTVGTASQVIATGTQLPSDSAEWQSYTIESGQVSAGKGCD